MYACRWWTSKQQQKNKDVPIVENLTPQNMPPDAPAILIPFLDEPVVPDDLGVKVKDLEGGVVDVVFGALEEEEAVVVDEFVPAVQVHEGGDVGAGGVVQQVRGLEVEVGGPELQGFGEVGDAAAEVAEFVDLGGAWEGGRGGLGFLFGMDCLFFRGGRGGFHC